MLDVLRKIFEANPEKSTIIIDGNCLICKRNVSVEIKPTSGGYGLLGGILVKSSPENYCIICAECHRLNAEKKPFFGTKSTHA